MSQASPSRFSDKFVVRLPNGVRDRLAELARENRRSMNAEFLVHLEAGLERTALRDPGAKSREVGHA